MATAKKNNASPGFNAIPYLVFKRCRSVLKALLCIIQKVWKTGDVPKSWAQAYIVLIAKSEKLDDPSEFRPIAVTNTAGKIFFSVMAERTQHYMVANGYIDCSVQKGFLAGIPGCVEHCFALWETLMNAIQQ